jgi:hypothetical protein
MRKNRFLSRLWSTAFVVVIAAGGVLLSGGVSDATTPSASARQVMAATDTSTELTTCPASPVPYGTRVTLTAKVTPATATGTIATGTVTFKDTTTDGATADLGTVPLIRNGTASVSTETPKTGTHSLTSVFTPANEMLFGGSTSAAVLLTVTGTDGSRSTQTVVPQEQLSGQFVDKQPILNVNVQERSVPDRDGLLGVLIHVLL